MKLRKLSAGIIAAALAATSCAIYASADVILDTIEADTVVDAADGMKVQWNSAIFPSEINEVTLKGVIPPTADGVVMGGGAICWNGSSDWQQYDFNVNSAEGSDEHVTELNDDGSFTITINAAELGKDTKMGEGCFMIGWWWGGNPIDATLTIKDLIINGESYIGKTVATASATDAATAGDTTAATDSTKAGSPDTGVEDVAIVAGLGVVAAGALVVAKKRK